MQALMEQAGITAYADGKILAAKKDGIGMMLFNQPAKLNAISVDMWQGIANVLDDFEADDQVHVLIMAGAGDKAFMSGGDISQFEKTRSNAEVNAEFARLTQPGRSRLTSFAKPRIACIRGWCLGGGMAVAMTADMRFASMDSQLGIPAARLSIAYGRDDIKRLIDLVGPAHARQILYTGNRLSAVQAERIGLINQAVESDKLLETVFDIAHTISNNAPLSVMASRITIDELLKDAAQRDNELIARQTTLCMNSADYAEGRRAFMEKRKPVFTGH
jgi:enoyl-CoA hydratase